MKIKCTLFFLLLVYSTFGQVEDSLSSEQRQFYEKLLNVFRENSIERAKIDWKEFERKVLEKAVISKDSAIILALDLNDNLHTLYKYQGRTLHSSKLRIKDRSVHNNNCIEVNLKNELPHIGYIEVAPFSIDLNNTEASKRKAEEYVTQILDSIKSQDKNELKGWIIDLRKNTGGNMWPMLIALTPFYPEGTLGYFIGDKKEVRWSKIKGEIFYDSFSQTNKYISKPIDYKLQNKNLKIAVLIGDKTCSSGEAVAISTKSITKAQLWGSRTFGFATANCPIEIADREFLVLTTSVDADVNKIEYWDGITPDFDFKCEEIIREMKKWFGIEF